MLSNHSGCHTIRPALAAGVGLPVSPTADRLTCGWVPLIGQFEMKEAAN
jgi:hypothetical protein